MSTTKESWNDRFRRVSSPPSTKRPNYNTPKPPRKKILCFHGSGSNNDITELQILNLNLPGDAHGANISCDLFEAKFTCGAQNNMLSLLSTGPFRTWVNDSSTTTMVTRWLGYGKNTSLVDSLLEIKEVIEQHGPYDGLYGFSLGAAIVTCVLHPVVWKDMFGFAKCPVSFAIFACAGGSHCLTSLQVPCDDENNNEEYKEVTNEEKIDGVSTLHLIGSKDWIKTDSESFPSWFVQSQVYEIPNVGHEIPMQLRFDPNIQGTLTQFLKDIP